MSEGPLVRRPELKQLPYVGPNFSSA